MKNFPCCIVLLLIHMLTGYAQIVNGYAEVTDITGSTLTLSSVDESGDTFENGELVVIMQMQDNVIGNVTNTATFGSLGSINAAGRYEIRAISSHVESAGVLTSIALTSTPANTYNTCGNCRVQVITFPTFGSPNYTTTANLSARAWNGITGGVLCFNVTGILTLAHNLSATISGFRGAATDVDATCGGAVCEDTVFISTRTTRGYKGEGIYRNTNTAYEAARGRMLNAGGGGSCHNGGGGGGGNFTAGGNGGLGYGCTAVSPRSAGGLGGLDLSAHISASRIFMGGGGGSGERNNGFDNSGGRGGGIVLIRANELRTSGTCGGRTITANGGTAPNVSNDGAGGGGAGGSIVIQVNTWNIAATCPITVSSNGGNGGTANDGSVHAGGGGGGQGVVIFSIAAPSSNTTIQTNNGNAGCNNNSNPCNSSAGSPSGASGSGIIGGASGPLPVSLIEFEAKELSPGWIDIKWKTDSEINNDYFTVYKSVDAVNWLILSKVKGAGNSMSIRHYNLKDEAPAKGWTYYRLLQTDFDGTTELSGMTAVEINIDELRVYPNPGRNYINIEKERIETFQVEMYDARGNLLRLPRTSGPSQIRLLTEYLPAGIYLLHIKNEFEQFTRKVCIEE